MNKRNWELFFKDEAPNYLDNCFTKNTEYEVEFIIQELELKNNEKILDIGCGTCRHSLELAKKGFKTTGIDLSEDQLNIARQKMNELGVQIKLYKGDVSELVLNAIFDHAICLCEGAFCLYEEGIDPIKYHSSILRNINKMLKSNGKFILNALNGFKLIRQYSDSDIENGIFDPISISEIMEHTLENGQKIILKEKYFLPSEIIKLLEDTGFKVLNIWGGTAGSWNKKPLKLDEMEMMIICEKVSNIE